MVVVLALAWLLALSLAAVAAYRALFALAFLTGGDGKARARPEERLRRFQVIVPAHDEELLIGDLVRSIRACRYPRDHIRILVVADNCSDRTAECVRDLGEQLLERHDRSNPGKGQALAWALSRVDLSDAEAVAFFDADNLVAPDFFSVMNDQLAQGWRCLQGYYDIANPEDSVMTRLLAVTYVMKNLLFNAGKARLGWSVLLMGTGMVFEKETIRRLGWRAMTIGEDYEQTFNLVDAGETIRFVKDARTRAQESSTLQQGYAQRQRWMSGRRVLIGRAWEAIVAGLRRRSWTQIEVGIELLTPPYSTMLNATFVGLALALALLPTSASVAWILAGVLAYQVLEVGVALVLMRASPRFVAALAFAPVFLVFRAGVDLLAAFGHRGDKWARTDRVSHSAEDASAEGGQPRA